MSNQDSHEHEGLKVADTSTHQLALALCDAFYNTADGDTDAMQAAVTLILVSAMLEACGVDEKQWAIWLNAMNQGCIATARTWRPQGKAH